MRYMKWKIPVFGGIVFVSAPQNCGRQFIMNCRPQSVEKVLAIS